jgi:hypothetical protein
MLSTLWWETLWLKASEGVRSSQPELSQAGSLTPGSSLSRVAAPLLHRIPRWWNLSFAFFRPRRPTLPHTPSISPPTTVA